MKIVLCLSGGIDSTTLFAKLINEGHDVLPVSFCYQSKHNKYELEQARLIANYFGTQLNVLDARGIFTMFRSDLLKGGGEIPEGHYEGENMKATVVPCRNMIFASILGGVAVSNDCGAIALGIHAGDHAIYPDCRPKFFLDFDMALQSATEGKVEMLAPFINLTKIDIVEKALRLRAPLHLTRTCYKDQAKECGKCGSCVEKAEAYKQNGIEGGM